MFSRFKRMMTQTAVNSFEPCVVLPVWKSVIVDMLTLFTFGICRWRWNGVTMAEWYDGFTIVTFTADESVKSDHESMELVDELMDALDSKIDQRTRISNKTLDALMRVTERLKSGEPIPAKRITVEHTPDGPLTTVEDVTI